MKPLFTQKEFENSKSLDLLPLQCEFCGKKFMKIKSDIKKALNNHPRITASFCSIKCRSDSKNIQQDVCCKNCGKTFKKNLHRIKKYPNHFCSQSCSGTYNNIHKSHGYRRSKLEVWIESQLTELYPALKIDYNKTDAINSELDIYIPSLKLAFELNGIFHYEPIYGEERLSKIQNNDERKFQACLEKSIELVLIDTSSQKYFKEKTSQKFLIIITTIINKKLELQ